MPRPRRLVSVAVAVVLGLWLLQGLGVVPAFGWMTRLAAPVSGELYSSGVGIGRWWDVVIHPGAILAERDYWQRQAEALASKVATTTEAVRQRDQLAALLKFKDQSGYDIVAARLLGSSPSGRAGTRVIDRGAESGVVVGQPVVSPGGSLIGVVREVWSGGAGVVLLDAPQSRVAAGPLGKQSSGGIVGGVYDLGLLLSTVRPDEPLEVGDIIGTAGTQAGLPRGLTIGTVRQVWRGEGELFTTAALEPMADVRSLTEIGVLLTL